MKGAEVRWIMLADSAEVFNNKVYMIGGGWETLTVNTDLPLAFPCAVVVSLGFPRTAGEASTLPIDITVRREDDEESIAAIEAAVQPSFAAHQYAAEKAQVILAFRLLLLIPKLGRYWIKVKFAGQEGQMSFAVIPGLNTEPISVPKPKPRPSRKKFAT